MTRVSYVTWILCVNGLMLTALAVHKVYQFIWRVLVYSKYKFITKIGIKF